MATLTLSNPTTNGCDWLISGLSNPFNLTYYLQAGVTETPFTDGVSSISGVLVIAEADSYGNDTFVNGNLIGLSSDTSYTLYGFAKAANGLYYNAGSDTITTLSERPSNFSWTSSKTSGGTFNLTASEWNRFTSRINEFRQYKGLSNSSFTTAVKGNDFTATIFNQARNSLYSLRNYFGSGETIPDSKSTDDLIYASYLNDMVNALNSIE